MKHGWQFLIFACAWALVGRLTLGTHPHPTPNDAVLIGFVWLAGFVWLTGWFLGGFEGAKQLLGSTVASFILIGGSAGLVILLLFLGDALGSYVRQ